MLTLGEKAERALRIVRESKEMAYDTETSGLNWTANQPVGYVITAGHADSYYIPIRHGGGNNLLDPNVHPLRTPTDESPTHSFERELANAFIERRRHPDKATIGHNLKFDMHFSANQGVMVGRNCYDTSLTEAMIDEFTRSFSLDALAKKYGVTQKLGDALYQRMADLFGGVADKKQMEHFWRLPGNDPIATDYAEGDGISTLELHHEQMKVIQEEDMTFIHGIESQLIWTVFKMERNGVRVDESVMAQTIEQMGVQIEEAKARLPRNFNTRSPKQVRELMEGAGHTDWPVTEVGNPSFPEKWLKKSEEGRAVIAVRQLTNLMNSFILPLKDTHMVNGRVHTNFNQLKGDEYGTISGRFSSSQPNMQQVPKRNKDLGKIFRRLFVPDPGFTFVEADYSQCEPRLFAHYSQEPSLIGGYTSVPPRDVHAVVADLLSVERDPTAKRMNMGILTGMQTKTFAGHMGLPINEATALFNQWFEAFPGIAQFQDQAKRVFKSRGYVKTILGRRCRLDNPRFAYRGTSRIIQGSNADIVKERLLALDLMLEQLYEEVQLNLTIHDSIGWCAPEGQCEEVNREAAQLLCRVQEPPYNLRVPFVMDVGSGANWAEATYGAH